ncbi:nucleotidyl transferase AbiEii/AbiGii toxin family protein [Pseudomonas alkylphenolica]|uniref:nucleotidyl transferase AbiEii/AbiGii toxin family protein n=1 Tax=Pseudomonas alkylphenolica TaxID=237609 RepID=UPI0018D9FDD6|nr:nucleotidyl transferase AbiEii/AbiGii toxin family protein [Pseudomonas alkylphenolica]MBH3427996.1 nucleotidyl transferase AbiEii/AbiGii toxin family protein [Pseudomonas alkylphenolica]
MPDHVFTLSADDQREVLLQAASNLDRPAFLLEKDLWVVWTLGKIFSTQAGDHLTFKGGTSLSKVYRLIDRFSEDIDLTYDIRQMLPGAESEIPPSVSQARKWTKSIRDLLPVWIHDTVVPVLTEALVKEGLNAELEQDNDKLYLHYPPRTPASEYVRPRVMLEFGARSSGEPHGRRHVTCDMANAQLEGVSFPEANPVVMDVARTFWEKATAAHVYCVQERLRTERFARHWHDLVAIGQSQAFAKVIAQRDIAALVAEHKSWFFIEKAADGSAIDYRHAVSGNLRLVPAGDALEELANDYGLMLADGMFDSPPPPFEELMRTCAELEERMNAAAII